MLEAKPGDFVKKTITFYDGRSAIVRFLFLVGTIQADPQMDLNPSAKLVYGNDSVEGPISEYHPILYSSDYLDNKPFGGRVRLRDVSIYKYKLKEPTETHTFEPATDEELIGLFFRTATELISK